jgi:hypothetical protein
VGIRIIPQKQINKAKWDQCIHASPNGLIYAESMYLDNLCADWFGIVKDDYEAVMPLCWREKFGIRYLFQPAFCQQGGIFSRKNDIQVIEPEFFSEVKNFSRFAEINLNYAHGAGSAFPVVRTLNNFLRDLSFKTYNTYIDQRLKRLQKFSLHIQNTDDVRGIVRDYQQLYGSRFPSVSENDYENFIQLALMLKEHGRVIMKEVRNEAHDLLASCLLLKDNRRIYNLISNLFPTGRTKLANYFLYDQVFTEYAGRGLLFDFEGSDLEGVKYFYEKFSTANQPFPTVKINDLPGPLKWLKKQIRTS